jgi:hypothetical protein
MNPDQIYTVRQLQHHDLRQKQPRIKRLSDTTWSPVAGVVRAAGALIERR